MKTFEEFIKESNGKEDILYISFHLMNDITLEEFSNKVIDDNKTILIKQNKKRRQSGEYEAFIFPFIDEEYLRNDIMECVDAIEYEMFSTAEKNKLTNLFFS